MCLFSSNPCGLTRFGVASPQFSCPFQDARAVLCVYVIPLPLRCFVCGWIPWLASHSPPILWFARQVFGEMPHLCVSHGLDLLWSVGSCFPRNCPSPDNTLRASEDGFGEQCAVCFCGIMKSNAMCTCLSHVITHHKYGESICNEYLQQLHSRSCFLGVANGLSKYLMTGLRLWNGSLLEVTAVKWWSRCWPLASL